MGIIKYTLRGFAGPGPQARNNTGSNLITKVAAGVVAVPFFLKQRILLFFGPGTASETASP